MRRLALLGAVLLIAGVGCKTAPIPDFPSIVVPPGMTSNQVETAILLTLAADENFLVDTMKLPTVDQLEQILIRAALRPPQRRSAKWYLKRRTPKFVEAEYRRRRHTLLVAFRYSDKAIQPTIIDSTNLKQSGDRIHKAAAVWTQQFSDRIGGSLHWVRQFPTEAEAEEPEP